MSGSGPRFVRGGQQTGGASPGREGPPAPSARPASPTHPEVLWQAETVDQPGVTAARTLPARFAAFCQTVVRVLPFGLTRVVAPRFVGFALINSTTFGVDLLILTALHGGLGWPVAVAISTGYVCAFALSFVLNRWLNFRSHAPVGRQTGWYVLAVAVNYVAILLGVGWGLTTLGVPYQAARIIAGAGEGVFMYCALRWVVFAAKRERG